MSNPYSLVFGKAPGQLISRSSQSIAVTEAFCDDHPTQQIFIITGVRGSGKTVFMNDIAKSIGRLKDWIVVELNPERDMLEALASKLTSENTFARIFKEAKINLSLFGIGLEVKGTVPVTDIEVALEKMLTSLQNKGKRLLITVDEAVNSKEMRVFAGTFQMMIRKDIPLFLLMTGLYENINDIQNEKSLTFLYRAPKIELSPLNIRAIADNYKKNCNVSENTAMEMARMTKGYSFAFQVLGHFTWKNNGFNEDTIQDFRQYLEDYAYEKIWLEMSAGDKKVAYGIANVPDGKIINIRKFLELETNQFNPYRKRLIKKGIIDGSTHGYVTFTLPFFGEYVLYNYDL